MWFGVYFSQINRILILGAYFNLLQIPIYPTICSFTNFEIIPIASQQIVYQITTRSPLFWKSNLIHLQNRIWRTLRLSRLSHWEANLLAKSEFSGEKRTQNVRSYDVCLHSLNRSCSTGFSVALQINFKKKKKVRICFNVLD